MDLVEEFARLGKALKWKIYYFIGFSAQASTLCAFFVKTNTLQAWDPPTFPRIFGLIFPTKRIFETTILLIKKAAICQPFLAVVRCLFHNHLRLKRSSLLNVHLKCKIEISFLTSHLFFSLFKFIYTKNEKCYVCKLESSPSDVWSNNSKMECFSYSWRDRR